VRDLFAQPLHPYTRALLETLPGVVGDKAERLRTIEGQPPALSSHPTACPFRERCRHRMSVCDTQNPPIEEKSDGHLVACFWDARSGAKTGAKTGGADHAG